METQKEIEVKNAIVAKEQIQQCGEVLDFEKVKSGTNKYQAVFDSNGFKEFQLDKEYEVRNINFWTQDNKIYFMFYLFTCY